MVKTSVGPRSAPRALVVEDERDVAELLRYHLAKEGYDVIVVSNGTEAMRQAREARPDLVLLDVMIPHQNGWEICRRLKQEPETDAIPVIMVTGRADEGDKIHGFEMGADDYVTKPFSPRELVARIRAVTRRGKRAADERQARFTVGDLEIDRSRFEAKMSGRVVELTRKEFELLAVLAASPGRVFGREALLDAVWGRDGFVEPRTVDVHIARLRARFASARVTPPPIDAVRGIGYRFRDPASA